MVMSSRIKKFLRIAPAAEGSRTLRPVSRAYEVGGSCAADSKAIPETLGGTAFPWKHFSTTTRLPSAYSTTSTTRPPIWAPRSGASRSRTTAPSSASRAEIDMLRALADSVLSVGRAAGGGIVCRTQRSRHAAGGGARRRRPACARSAMRAVIAACASRTARGCTKAFVCGYHGWSIPARRAPAPHSARERLSRRRQSPARSRAGARRRKMRARLRHAEPVAARHRRARRPAGAVRGRPAHLRARTRASRT